MSKSSLGAVIATFTAVIWGFVYVTTEGITEKLHPLALTAASYITGAVFLLPVFWWYRQEIWRTSVEAPHLLGVSIAATLVADLAIIWSISLLGGTSAGLIEVSYPIWTAIFVYCMFGRQPNPATIFGGILILIGVFVIGTWGGTKS